jgi:O-antigen/teichoic acid export membrane protein
MKSVISNAVFGMLDYGAYPIGMLLVAPIVLRYLGPVEYGIWAVATAALSIGGIIASGFGDANIKHVAALRNSADEFILERIVRSAIAIHWILGIAISLAGWLLAPYIAQRVVPADLTQQTICLLSVRIASILVCVRSLETVCISTQRAFERYGAAVRLSLSVRLATLAGAALLAYLGRNIAVIMLATALIYSFGTWLQFIHLRRLLNARTLSPVFHRHSTWALIKFGKYSWLLAVSGVIFWQVDRLFLGVSLGAVAVTSYALCVQLTQPIYGLAASGLHFLFPYLSYRIGTVSRPSLRHSVLLAFVCNLIFVVCAAGILAIVGQRLLAAWAGPAIAKSSALIFRPLLWGSALLALNVTGNYTVLAIGKAQATAWLNIGGGLVMLLMMGWLLPIHGVQGLAIARIVYGALSLAIYLPLVQYLFATGSARSPIPADAAYDYSEVPQI